MEKTLTPEERIRKAEQIYYRRKHQDINRKKAKVNISNKKDFGMFKKMILQIVICILIYSTLCIIKNTNYIFSEDVINKIKNILSYDINIKQLYEQGMKYLNSFVDDLDSNDYMDLQKNNILETNEINIIDTTTINENQTNENLEISNTNSIEEQNVGGENVEIVEEPEKVEPLSQMEQDAKYILENKSLTIPLKGTVTSRFGQREPQTPTVPKNHTGIDIAANQGTVFIAAMSGIVEEVSSERRFR